MLLNKIILHVEFLFVGPRSETGAPNEMEEELSEHEGNEMFTVLSEFVFYILKQTRFKKKAS